MDIGLAIKYMKQGKRVAREGWNGKDMFLYIVTGTNIAKENLRGNALINLNDSILDGANVDINSHIDMKTADGSICVGWLASQTDLLAEDWFIVD